MDGSTPASGCKHGKSPRLRVWEGSGSRVSGGMKGEKKWENTHVCIYI